jgi:hypothetical protein
MLRIFILLNTMLLLWQCTTETNDKSTKVLGKNQSMETEEEKIPKPKYDSIRISDTGLIGYFKGPEFDEDGDIGHQFSNTVAKIVGQYLKEAYTNERYLKVNFNKLKITTKGLDQKDSVHYIMEMPFLKVSKCKAFTGIEHCGSWNDQPMIILDERMTELTTNLKSKYSVGKMEQKFIRTPEGLVEYWIQFKHKDYQKTCY